MSLDNITQQIAQKLSLAPPLGAKIKVDFGDDGVLFIDGNATPAAISIEDDGSGDEPDTTFILSMSVFEGLLNGTQDPTMAFMTGKLKVKGSMGYAMKLNGILED